ncbi:unnamed protein product [Pleuronectes platessa]|uniref:Uncharacterized protein n=1 Tax=Pleuronectes platessa TaxID=8262 RepID=A0A9N7Z5E9_PLEPL|nr:unnamed protein product [Pleuronectes platessa]
MDISSVLDAAARLSPSPSLLTASVEVSGADPQGSVTNKPPSKTESPLPLSTCAPKVMLTGERKEQEDQTCLGGKRKKMKKIMMVRDINRSENAGSDRRPAANHEPGFLLTPPPLNCPDFQLSRSGSARGVGGSSSSPDAECYCRGGLRILSVDTILLISAKTGRNTTVI